MGRSGRTPGDASTPVTAGFGPIIAIVMGMAALLLALVAQVAIQALPGPVPLRSRLAARWLTRLLARAVALGWFFLLAAALLVALAAGLYGLFANGWQ